MPLYTLMLRDDEVDPAAMTDEARAAIFQRFVEWAAELDRRDRLRGVERLVPSRGRTVRRRGGALIVDGPYTEGREQILGYFLVEAADLDEAVAIAAEAPCVATGGSVEVREVGDFPKPRPR